MSGAIHDMAIEHLRLQDRQINRKHFAKTFRKILLQDDKFKEIYDKSDFRKTREAADDGLNVYDAEFSIFVRPDAWKIDKENRAVYLYEVEDAHPLSMNQIKTYAGLFWQCDEICWDMHLFVVDRLGINIKEVPVAVLDCASNNSARTKHEVA